MDRDSSRLPDGPKDVRLVLHAGGFGRPHHGVGGVRHRARSPDRFLAEDRALRGAAFSNHNGGFVGFGPDGYLYLSLGDGGSGNDPGGRARNLNTLLGKMIRIDVDGAAPYQIPADNPYVGAAGRDEIWASGLRNPWRWSMDDGNLYVGDVGQ